MQTVMAFIGMIAKASEFEWRMEKVRERDTNKKKKKNELNAIKQQMHE